MSYLVPGTKVTIARVDIYGLYGRDQHPPLEEVTPTDEYPFPLKSPCDGKEAYIAEYCGWDHPNGEALLITESHHEADPEKVHEIAPAKDDEGDEATHYYRAVVQGIGYFEFADYEFVNRGESDESVINGNA